MMRTTKIIGTLVQLLCLFLTNLGCLSDTPTHEQHGRASTGMRIEGFAQKGPLLQDSKILFFLADAQLELKGEAYQTDILNDAGQYTLQVQDIIAPAFGMLQATGRYYHESLGTLSEDSVSLKAYVRLETDTADSAEAFGFGTINILTHLIAERQKRLIAEGSTWLSAQNQAVEELITQIGMVPPAFELKTTPTTLHLASSVSADVAYLFGLSAIIDAIAGSSTRSLQFLLDHMATDFADGAFSRAQQEALRLAAQRLDFDASTQMYAEYRSTINALGTAPIKPSHVYDRDEDGVIDAQDNCVVINNPSQTDSDADGHGDACQSGSNIDSCISGQSLCYGGDVWSCQTGDGGTEWVMQASCSEQVCAVLQDSTPHAQCLSPQLLTRCHDAQSIQYCTQTETEQCTEWTPPIACEQGFICTPGNAADQNTHNDSAACTVDDSICFDVCDPNTHISQCIDGQEILCTEANDGDLCFDYVESACDECIDCDSEPKCGQFLICPSGLDCIQGQCVDQHSSYLRSWHPPSGDYLGSSAATHQGFLVVGAPYERRCETGVNPSLGDQTDNCPHSGAAYVHRRYGSKWGVDAYIKAPDTEDSQNTRNFGLNVGLLADVIDDTPLLVIASTRKLFFYRRISGRWTLVDTVPAIDSNAQPGFIGKVAFSEQVIAAGSWSDSTCLASNASCPSSGAVYVFELDGDSWNQTAFLKADEPIQGALLGADVATHSGRIIAGASSEEVCIAESCIDAGAVYVFEKVEEQWQQTQHILSPQPTKDARFGLGVTLEQDTLMIGSTDKTICQSGYCPKRGRVYVYQHDADVWTWTHTIEDPQPGLIEGLDNFQQSLFGTSLALQNGRLLVGDYHDGYCGAGRFSTLQTFPLDYRCSASPPGAAYLFTQTDGQWALQEYFKPRIYEALNFGMGWFVNLSEHFAIVATPGDSSCDQGNAEDGQDSLCPGSGSVAVFDLDTPPDFEPPQHAPALLDAPESFSAASGPSILLSGACQGITSSITLSLGARTFADIPCNDAGAPVWQFDIAKNATNDDPHLLINATETVDGIVVAEDQAWLHKDTVPPALTLDSLCLPIDQPIFANPIGRFYGLRGTCAQNDIIEATLGDEILGRVRCSKNQWWMPVDMGDYISGEYEVAVTSTDTLNPSTSDQINIPVGTYITTYCEDPHR